MSPCRAVYSPVITVNQAHILSKSDQQVPERCLGSAVSLYHKGRGNRIEQKPNPRRHQTARKREQERSEGRDYQSFPVSRGMMHDRTAHNARANETARDVAPFFHIYPEINEGAARACTRVSSSFRSSPRGPSATSARCPAAHYAVEADALPVPESSVVPLAGARHPTGHNNCHGRRGLAPSRELSSDTRRHATPSFSTSRTFSPLAEMDEPSMVGETARFDPAGPLTLLDWSH